MVTGNGSVYGDKGAEPNDKETVPNDKGTGPSAGAATLCQSRALYRNISRHRVPVIPDFQSAVFTLKDRYVR